MQYLGGKCRIVKYLLPIMLEERAGRPWVEPFVGGANVICKVKGVRIGNDIHKYLIKMYKALQDGWIPPVGITKEMYYNVKNNQKKCSDELFSFVGFACSFGGKWWNGYAKNKRGDNYAKQGHMVLVKQAKNFDGIDFRCGTYLNMEIPSNSIIYCDPPYADTTKYKDNFDHDEFWQWCRDMSMNGHIVFISEYKAPDDFKCIKTIEHKTLLNKNNKSARIEKLFKYDK